MTKLAYQAGLCYNRPRKLLCSRGAVTSLERVTSSVLRSLATMDSLSPHDFTPQELPFDVIEHVIDGCQCEGKSCSKCHYRLCVGSFYTAPSKKRSSAQCFDCEKASRQARYDPEKARIRKKKHYRQHTATHNQRCQDYYRKHAISIIEQKKRYYETSVEQRSAWSKMYQQTHAEQIKAYRQSEDGRRLHAIRESRRRDRKRHAGGHYTLQEWNALKAEYNYHCLCCGKQEPEIVLTADHVIPVQQHGSSHISNIQPLCLPCNDRKWTKSTDYRPLWKQRKGSEP